MTQWFVTQRRRLCIGGLAALYLMAQSAAQATLPSPLNSVVVRIINVECDTNIHINPLSRSIQSFRIRGVIIPVVLPGMSTNLSVSIQPVPVTISNRTRNAQIPILLSGSIGSTRLSPQTSQNNIPVPTNGNIAIPFDIIGTPAINRGSNAAFFPAGNYTGTLTIQASIDR